MNGTAIDVWRLASAGHSPSSIAAIFAQAYGGTAAPEAEIEAVYRAMVKEELARPEARPIPSMAPPVLPGEPFRLPEFRSFPIDGLTDFMPL